MFLTAGCEMMNLGRHPSQLRLRELVVPVPVAVTRRVIQGNSIHKFPHLLTTFYTKNSFSQTRVCGSEILSAMDQNRRRWNGPMESGWLCK